MRRPSKKSSSGSNGAGSHGVLGMALGAFLLAALVFFIFSGGDKKTVTSDDDLPPVTAAK